MEEAQADLPKAVESLASAQGDYAATRYNSCANRVYYACFQAAVAARLAVGIRPANPRGEWSHEFVQSQFNGLLITRRKLYPAALALPCLGASASCPRGGSPADPAGSLPQRRLQCLSAQLLGQRELS